MSSTFALLISFLFYVPSVFGKQPDTVSLSNLTSITLFRGQLTTSFRSPAIPQLECIRGPCRDQPVNTVQCYNRGFDGRDIQWECKTADLHDGFTLEVVDVNCEGFPKPEDRNIIVGSCGLRYGIGGGAVAPFWGHIVDHGDHVEPGPHGFGILGTIFIVTLVLILLVLISYCLYTALFTRPAAVVTTTPLATTTVSPSTTVVTGTAPAPGFVVSSAPAPVVVGSSCGPSGFGTGMVAGMMLGSMATSSSGATCRPTTHCTIGGPVGGAAPPPYSSGGGGRKMTSGFGRTSRR